MPLLPATAELADKAGIGPEGHRRTSSVESADTDTTLVDNEAPGLDAGAKLGELVHAPSSPVPKRVASDGDLAVHSAQRGRVTAEAALGAPVGPTTTTNDAEGSPAAAAPITISTFTATALAVAGNATHNPQGPDEASKTDDKETTYLTPGDRNASGTTSGGVGDDAAAPVSSSAAASPSICDQVDVNKRATSATPPRRKPPRALGLQAPPSPTITAATLAALDAITGGDQSSDAAAAIDWAAVAASAKPFNVPPASQTALRHVGPAPQSDQQPLSPILAGHVHLVNSVSLGWPGIDPDPVAERHLHAQAAELRGKVIGLMAGVGGHTNGVPSASQEEDDEEDRQAILDAAEEAELADLELYRDDEQAGNCDDDDDEESFNPEWLN